MFNWSFNMSKRTHRGLRHWVLYLLQDSPKNGVEIMDAMEAMSRGWWRPSPGSVYPLLESMAKEGVVKKLEGGRYEVTPAGKGEMDWPKHGGEEGPRSVEDVVEQLAGYVSYLEDLASSDGAKVRQNSQRLKELGERLGRIGGAKA